MPQSFITTGGFDSPVMPEVKLVDPRYFGNISSSFLGGMKDVGGITGELQRQKLLGEAAPLEVARQKQILALAPLEMQEAKLNIAKASMPVPVEEGYVDIPTGIPGSNAPLDQPAREQAKKIGLYTYNPALGKMERTGERFIPVETEAVRETRQSKAALDAARSEAAAANAKANAMRAQLGGVGNRSYVSIGPDGEPHLFKDAVDPNTMEVTTRDLGPATEAISKMKLEGAKTTAAEAAAKRPSYMPKNDYLLRKAADAAAKLNLDVGTYSALADTDEGSAALQELEASLATARKAGVVVPLGPAALATIKAARAKAQADGMAAAANPEGTVAPAENPLLRSFGPQPKIVAAAAPAAELPAREEEPVSLSEDQQAILWAQQHPDDPRAAAILKANGLP